MVCGGFLRVGYWRVAFGVAFDVWLVWFGLGVLRWVGSRERNCLAVNWRIRENVSLDVLAFVYNKVPMGKLVASPLFE